MGTLNCGEMFSVTPTKMFPLFVSTMGKFLIDANVVVDQSNLSKPQHIKRLWTKTNLRKRCPTTLLFHAPPLNLQEYTPKSATGV